VITNSEFFLEGGRSGVLLIHGLTGTPNEMRLLATGLNRAGFTVYGMQLAGHCGNEEDLLKTSWKDWCKSVDVAADKLAESVDHVFVAGLSMGALLALRLAAEHPEKISGVGVFGPTFKYDGWSIPTYAKHLSFLLNWLKFFNLFQKRQFIEQPPYGLKDERLRSVILKSMQEGDSASAGLAGNPWRSLAEMQTLSRNVRKQLSDVLAPCLIIHSNHDDVANIRNSKLVEKKVKGPTEFIALDNSYHMITIDRERKKVTSAAVNFFQAIVAKKTQEIDANVVAPHTAHMMSGC